MNTSIQVLNFQQNTIRTTLDAKGEMWFLANDVCNILGYTNSRRTVSLHCKEKGVTKRYTPTESGNQEMVYINEPNLYRLIIKSRKTEAEQFEEWVMEEVLPTIRKTGSYSGSPKTKKALPNGLTIEQQEEIKKFQRELCAAVPKEKQRNLSIALWSAVKAKFGVGYKEVAPEHYLEVMSLMARVAVEKGVLYGEVLDKEQPKGILISEEQVYQLSTLTRYAQRMSLDFEHIAPALDRLDSKLAGRAYSWGVEPNHWICCIQRFLMQATKQMTNPKYIEGVRDNFVHMI